MDSLDALDLLRDLVRRPSVTPHDAGCQARISQILKGQGFETEDMRWNEVSNLWATHGNGRPVVCLAGHTDVVPPGPREMWTSDPFLPRESDGSLYARGASDMKGSVAAMTIALAAIARAGHAGTICLLLTSDEEGPARDGTRRVLEELTTRGTVIDAAIVGEPSSEKAFGDVIKIGRRGSMNGRLAVQGVQGHTAYPHLSVNAIHRLAPALAVLANADWGCGTDHFPPTTLQFSDLMAGTGASNVIPGLAEARFNLRFGNDWTAESLQDRISEILRQAGVDEPVAWHVSAQPFLTKPGPLADAVAEAIRRQTGVQPQASTGGGTSDARFFAAIGVPVVEFGPLNHSIHAVDEHIDIACLAPLVNIYADAVRNLSRGLH